MCIKIKGWVKDYFLSFVALVYLQLFPMNIYPFCDVGFWQPLPEHLLRTAEPNLAGGSKALLQVDPISFLLHLTIEVIICHVPHQQGVMGHRQEAPLHGWHLQWDKEWLAQQLHPHPQPLPLCHSPLSSGGQSSSTWGQAAVKQGPGARGWPGRDLHPWLQ